MYRVELLKNDCEWEEFISNRNGVSQYHSLGWRDVIIQSFGHLPLYLVAKDDNIVKGILPLFLIKSVFWGNLLISVPFLNYGGLCVEDSDIGGILLDRAIQIAEENNVKYLELRDLDNYNLKIPVKKNKITMILELESDSKLLWESLNAKIRNQVRKAQKSGLTFKVGGDDLLGDFYKVFCINMRDLGTPVYGKDFFRNILLTFPNETKIFVVYLSGEAVASGFTIAFNNTLEIPWASSVKKFNKLSSNTLMYWEVIKYSCENGYKYFDFGRCTIDSNTFIFKKSWGAKPKQLYWHYWVPEGRVSPELNPANPKYQLFIKIWKKLPLFLAGMIGPRIIKFIP